MPLIPYALKVKLSCYKYTQSVVVKFLPYKSPDVRVLAQIQVRCILVGGFRLYVIQS